MPTTNNIPSHRIIDTAHRIKSEWDATPAIFEGFRYPKSEFDTALTAANAAVAQYAEAKANRSAEKKRLRAIKDEEIAKLRATYTRASSVLDESFTEAGAARKAALLQLSRLAQGARYYAKSTALSDTDPTNDATGKRL